MQTLEERRAYLRDYRARNVEKIREIRRRSAWKTRGRKYIPDLTKQQTTSIHSTGFVQQQYEEIKVSLCQSCGRKYLQKLYCLWCTNK